MVTKISLTQGLFALVDNAARELFGDFAALNFPKPGERSAITGEIIPTEMEIAS